MSLVFTLEAIGTVQVERELLRFGERAMDAGPLWRQIKNQLRLIETAQFLTQGSHGGTPWEPLKEATIAAKRRKGQQPWILRATEALFRSLTGSGVGSISEAAASFMRYGTELPYAVHHQFGAPGANIPARPIVHLTPLERVEIAKQVQRFIVTGAV